MKKKNKKKNKQKKKKKNNINKVAFDNIERYTLKVSFACTLSVHFGVP